MDHIFPRPSVFFEVERIIAISKGDGDFKTYCVQWAPSWVTGAQLAGCQHLINEFLSTSFEKNPKIHQESEDIQERPSMVMTGDFLEDGKDEVPNMNSHYQKDKSPLLIPTDPLVPQTEENHNDNDTEISERSSSMDFFPVEGGIEEIDNLEKVANICKEEVFLDFNNIKTVIVEPNEPVAFAKVLNTFKCTSCEKTFKSSRQLFDHTRLAHHPENKNLQGRKLENKVKNIKLKKGKVNKLQKPNANPGSKLRILEKQPVSLTKKIKKNEITHIDEHPLFCNVCQKSFSHRDSLDSHNCVKTCSYCQKQFTKTASFKAHLLTHSSDRPFVCSVCSKGFKLQSKLKRHRLVHTGEKPYSCVTCKKAFSLLHHLKRHMNVHVK